MDTWLQIRTYLGRGLWASDLNAQGPLTRLGTRVLRFCVVAWWEFWEGALNLRAAGLAYTTLLSLIPLLAVAFSLLKAFGVHQGVEPFLEQALEPLGEQGAEITRRVVDFVNNIKVGVLGTVGVVALLYTAISLLDKIEEAFNHIWRARHPRSLGRKFADYLSVVLVGPVLVFAALALTASVQSHWLVQRFLAVEPVGAIILAMAGRVIPFVFLCAAFTFLYKFVPYTPVQLSSAFVGGATAALLYQVTGTAFASFVAQSPRYTAIYSGFAILVLFLIWVYVAWLIILVGAQIAYFHQYPASYLTRALRRRGHHLFRERLALAALLEVTRRHLAAGPPYGTSDLAGALNAPPSSLEDLLEEFVRRGILFRTAEPEGIALGRPPELVPVVEILDAVRDPEILGREPSGESGDPVSAVLRRRDAAAQHALDGVTLRSLAVTDPADRKPGS